MVPNPLADLGPASLDAVVLAGGLNTRELYPGYRPGYKALVELHGRPLIRYVLDALRASQLVRRIGVVGSEADLRPVVGADTPIVPAADNLLGSVMSGLSLFPDERYVLLATADLAMLEGAMVDGFVEACAREELAFQENVFLAVVPKQRFTGAFAACGKSMNAFRDLTVCHGNLLLATPGLLRNEDAKTRLNAMYAGRLSPVRSAMAFGVGLGLTYVLGVHYLHLVSLKRMAAMASRRFGFGILPVVCPHPQVAVDIDEAGDYRIAQEVVGAS